MCYHISDMSYIQFFGDDFLRLLLLRYVFCHVVLRHHRAFNVSLLLIEFIFITEYVRYLLTSLDE